jgi:DNA polymerase IV (archaeal DinB-like DNA polymerase)
MRIILHIDMDAFFASVEERDKPRLKGLPIVVGSDPAGGKGRGVVATANYAARKYGIKSAMPISRAWNLSQQAKKAGKPEVVFMEGSFRRYAEASRDIFEYIATMGDAFEAASVDEGYLEITENLKLITGDEERWEAAEGIAKKIQDVVQEKFGLSCSIGVGPNKLIAKIAAGREKPHGLTVVSGKEVQEFLDPLPVRELLGIGPKTGEQLHRLGVETIVQLRARSREELVEHFGKWGEGMHQSARGIDDSPVQSGGEAKSIGAETTFDVDTIDARIIIATFKELAGEVARSVKKAGKKFKTVSIVVRFSNFETKTRAHTLEQSSDQKEVLEREGVRLLLPFLDSRENPKHLKLRLVGIRAERFVAPQSSSGDRRRSKQAELF